MSLNPPFKYDSVPIHWQPINRETFTLSFNQVVGAPKTLASPVTLDSYTIILNPGHGFVIGEIIFLTQDGNVFLAGILNVVTNTITVDTPLNFAYSNLPQDENLATIVLKVVNNMNVDGSVTPQKFEIFAPGNHVWAITRGFVTMILEGQPDDGLFGDQGKLTRGVIFRVKNGQIYNKGNFKDNGDIAGICYDLTYTERTVPLGSYGLRARVSFASPSKAGNAIVLDGAKNDAIEMIIQDDLTDITEFQITAQGTVLK
jgi:hypothetical protein